jgi:hypothetical protein
LGDEYLLRYLNALTQGRGSRPVNDAHSSTHRIEIDPVLRGADRRVPRRRLPAGCRKTYSAWALERLGPVSGLAHEALSSLGQAR